MVVAVVVVVTYWGHGLFTVGSVTRLVQHAKHAVQPALHCTHRALWYLDAACAKGVHNVAEIGVKA